MNLKTNRHILLIDDLPAIHADFRKILAPEETSADLNEIEADLFGDTVSDPFADFALDSAYQGSEGVSMIEKSLQENKPYAFAFVDMWMPPGMDGVETNAQIWQNDPRLQVVICSAYSDSSFCVRF